MKKHLSIAPAWLLRCRPRKRGALHTFAAAGASPVPAGPIETPKVSAQTIQEVVALLTNGKKTAILLGSRLSRR